jgi:hypothetical protein
MGECQARSLQISGRFYGGGEGPRPKNLIRIFHFLFSTVGRHVYTSGSHPGPIGASWGRQRIGIGHLITKNEAIFGPSNIDVPAFASNGTLFLQKV